METTLLLKLDHLTVIAPTLQEGVSHVQDCLDIDVPFGTRHHYMGTHNHRLQLGGTVYLEIVAVDPMRSRPDRARWFGLDNPHKVRSDWDKGRRFRGCVASTINITKTMAANEGFFGEPVPLPPDSQEFMFSIPADGSLPLDGAVPSLIDHKNDPTSMSEIPDLGAKLLSYCLEHSDPDSIIKLYQKLAIDRPPEIKFGPELRWSASVDTPNGVKQLT